MSSRTARNAAGLLATVLAAVLAVTACGKSSNSSSSGGTSGEIKLGLITKTETNPFFVKMKEGAAKEAAAKGAKLLTAAGKFDGDNASQATAIENMVAAGVKGILITPSDTKAIVPSIQKARAKGVEVIALDLAPGITVGVLRHNGFLSGFGAASVDDTASDQVTSSQVVCSQDTQGDQAKGQTAMENCLQK